MTKLETLLKKKIEFVIIGTDANIVEAEPLLKKLGMDMKSEWYWNDTHRNRSLYNCIKVYEDKRYLFLLECVVVRRYIEKLTITEFIEQANQILHPTPSPIRVYFQQSRKVWGKFWTAVYIAVVDYPRKPFMKWLWIQVYTLIPLMVVMPLIAIGILILTPVLADDSWDAANSDSTY